MILEKEFFQAPNAVFDNLDLGLSRYDRIVYLYLCRCSNQGADAFPGYRVIARKCGISRATARRAVKSLEDKEFITVTRRPKSNRDNESNLYQVNLLPSITGTPGVVSHRHRPSATGTPPLVKQGNQSSTQVIPYKEPIINNHLKKNHGIKNQSIKGTTIVEDISSGKQAHQGLASLTEKTIKGTTIKGDTSAYGDRIKAFLRSHGPAPIKAISQATGIDRNSVNTTLHLAKGKRFLHLTERRA
jgi:DNA-binding transcriptional regulator LsrR (DeoR family)